MRFLIVPANNSLSHLGKALALEATLRGRGCEVFVAVSQARAHLVKHLGERGRILPDLQEIDGSGYPTAEWFRDPKRTAVCIQAEVDLLKEIKPDRALGIFRFTLKASAQLAGIPYDSLACGCMLPETSEVLGFAEGEPGILQQKEFLKLFYSFAGARTNRALKILGLDQITDIREMLKGERTYLWDFNAFSPLPESPDILHVGPISWQGWSQDRMDLERLHADPRPLALLTFGTCVGSAEVATRMVRSLLAQGYQVVLAAGGQEDLLKAMAGERNVIACRFAPLHQLMPQAKLLVCHGGQLTIFEALAHRVPVVVMPFQAEQAHNGVCLERMNCGRRITPPRLFRGDPRVYVEAFKSLQDQEIEGLIANLIVDPRTTFGLLEAQRTLLGLNGAETLANELTTGE